MNPVFISLSFFNPLQTGSQLDQFDVNHLQGNGSISEVEVSSQILSMITFVA
jgi:hypothetical protein